MTRKRIAAVAAIALVAAIGIAVPALATSDTVIGFDDLSAGTVVTNQYQSQGVEFGTAASFGHTSPGFGDCGSPRVTAGTAASPAFSAPNYAQLATCSPPGGTVVYYAGTVGEFTNYLRGSVSAEVSLTSRFANTGVTLNGYDSSGNIVATGTATATDAGWTKITAEQNSGSPVPAQISYFELTTSSASASAPPLAIDDLSFDQAGAPLGASGSPITAQAGSLFSGQVASISDGDTTASPSDYAATITWGDGASSAGTVSAAGSPGRFTVSGSHTWASGGSYPVHVAVTKINGRTAATDTTATVAGPGGTGGGGGTSSGGSSPTASGQVVTPNPTAGGLVEFSGASSTPGSGRIVAYDWGFDNPNTTTSTGTNPDAHWIFKPGLHTVTLTVTNSGGQKSTTHFGLSVGQQIISSLPDGGQGDCKPTYDAGNVHIVADCIQTLAGGGYVIETKFLQLNGMVLAPKPGSALGVYKILPFNHFGVGSGTELTGPAVNVELLNTPVGDMVIGGRDLTANPLNLTFTAFRPPTFQKFARDAGARAHVADDDNKTLLMSLGVGKECTSGNKDPNCCPSGETTACATVPGGFPLMGQVNVYLNNKGQSLFDVQVGLDLSAVNFQASGALEIEADPVNGINLNSLQFTITEAGLLDIFQVRNASFVYYFPSDPDQSKADTWQAKGTIVFGPLQQPSLQAELDFKHGQFQKASMLFTAPTGTGVPIFTGVLLNQIGATVGVNPIEFGGQLGASIATQLELSLGFLYSAPTDTQLGFFGGQGKLTFQGDDIATLAADVYSDGYTDAAIDINLHYPFDSNDPVVSVKGHIGFWDEPSSGRWEADGSVSLKLWVISAEVAGLISDKQVAGCADISGFGVQGHYDFSNGGVGGGFFGFSNCDDQLKQYKETPVTPHTGGFIGSAGDAPDRGLTAADTRGGGTVRLPGGTDGQELLINSASGTPQVTIYTPNHQIYTTPSQPGQISTANGEFISAIAPDTHQVIMFLRRPHGGLYNIQPTAGSAPISSVAAAQDVPPAQIHIRVTHRRGRTWSLHYKIKHYVAGTRVQFVERGRDSTHVIATVVRASGTVAFVPQDAIARSRTIFAYLQTSSGAPLRTMSVGRYLAPLAQRPGRIAHARFLRHGTSAVLSWAAAPGARQYRVVVSGSDGRLISGFTSPARRSLTLGQVLPTERFTATVTPLGGPNLLPGRGARAILSAASTGLVELLSCHKGSCSGRVVPGSLVPGSGEIQAALRRGGGTLAGGIASDGKPTQVSLAVRHALTAGHYTLTLRYRGRRASRQITIR